MTQAAALAAYGSNSPSNRNRIINGDMRVSQRGTSFAGLTNGSSQYTVDRWRWAESGTFTGVQTVTQDSSAPSGFTTSWKVETTTAVASLASNEGCRAEQLIEGYNITDLAWGTADAKSIALSFWVRSSLTGTFGGGISNSDRDRSYPFTYSISAANTWEYKTIVVPGDTTGTWLTDSGVGMRVRFGLGVGSTLSGAAGAWAAADYQSATGAVSVIGTSGATFYITGVQLEAGSVATPFEHRQYGQELVLCQRYYTKTYPVDVAPGTNTGTSIAIGRSTDAASSYTTIAQWAYPVTMRATPSISLFNPVTGTVNSFRGDASNHSPSQTIFTSTCAVTASAGGVSIGTSTYVSTHIVASAEL